MNNTSFDKVAAEKKLDEIYSFVTEQIALPENPISKISLYGGNMGLALFLYEYSKYKPETLDQNNDLIVGFIDQAFETIGNEINQSRTFCSGIIGTLWTIDFLRQKKVLDMEDDYLDQDIIKLLEGGSLMDTLRINHCDLLHGGFGFWAYLVQNTKLPNWEVLIQNQLDALNKIAIKIDDDKLNWKINPRYMQEDPEGVNLGLAHGICAIIILLAKLKLTGYKSDFVDESLEKGLNFILSKKLSNVTSSSLYPSTIIKGQPSLNGRLGWCYGDFCIALACWHAWKATGKENYKKESLEIMTHAAGIDPKFAYANDCGLCHGTAGISHIFRKFYWETNDEVYLKAADYWMDQTLKMDTRAEGYCGYMAYRTPEHGGPIAEIGTLEGVAGIGLALTSALTNKNGDWADFLLIN